MRCFVALLASLLVVCAVRVASADEVIANPDPAVVAHILSGRAEQERDSRIVGGAVMGGVAVGATVAFGVLSEPSEKNPTLIALAGGTAIGFGVAVPVALLIRGPHEQLYERHKERLTRLAPSEAAARTSEDWAEKAGTEHKMRIAGGVTGVVLGGLLAAVAIPSLTSRAPASQRGDFGEAFAKLSLVMGGASAAGGVLALALPGPLERSYGELRGDGASAAAAAPRPTLRAHVPGLSVGGSF